MNHTTQKCTCGQDDGLRLDFGTIRETKPDDTIPIHQKVGRLTFDDCQVFASFQLLEHGLPIDLAIRLSARSLYGWALASVQQPKLNPGKVRNTAHYPIHRIDFPDKMAFSEPANRRITRHNADSAAIEGDKSGIRAYARRCVGGFCTCMTASDDSNVKMFHVKHSLLTQAKTGKNLIQ